MILFQNLFLRRLVSGHQDLTIQDKKRSPGLQHRRRSLSSIGFTVSPILAVPTNVFVFESFRNHWSAGNGLLWIATSGCHLFARISLASHKTESLLVSDIRDLFLNYCYLSKNLKSNKHNGKDYLLFLPGYVFAEIYIFFKLFL